MAGPALATTGARLSAWLRPDRAFDHPASLRATARRRVYDDIGDFLMMHDLELSDHNFAVARAHLAHEPEITQKIDDLLRAPGHLTDAMLAAIGKPGAAAIDPEYVADVAHHLNLKLAECLRIVNASSASGEDYRAAIELVETTAASDPEGAVERMIALTRCVVDATRAMEEQLDGARRETERLRSNLQRARRDADHDHLTKLPNRRVFERLLEAIPRESGAIVPHCVALCDIDDFKAINDQHGHETGDRVLRFIAQFLRATLGEGVHLARYGGEEFACLFEGQSAEQAFALLDDARQRLGSRSIASRENGKPIGHVTFSAGLVAVAGDPRECVRQADEALYEAKRAGKDRIVVGSRGAALEKDAA